MENMNTMRRWQRLTMLGLGLTLAALTGCQTWVPTAGITLPSGRYLEHSPQYLPPSPPFPLTRELAYQEDVNSRAVAGAPAAPPPAPVPGVPGGGVMPGGAGPGPGGPGPAPMMP
jgi:hypothetical protein